MINIDGLYVEITDKCNLSCSYCCRECSPKKGHYLDVKVIDELLNGALRLGAKTIAVSGGEPLLHPELNEIVSLTHNYGCANTILTNGVLLPKITKEVVRLFDNIQISLDSGIQQTNDLTRGKGSYKGILNGITHIISEGYKPEMIALKMTLTSQNYREIEYIFKLAENLGIKTVGFSFLFEEGRAKGDNESLLSDVQKEQVLTNIQEIERTYPQIIVYPPGFTDECPLIHRSRVSPRIDCFGNVYACQMFEKEYSLGNIYEKDISKILNGETFENLVSMIESRQASMPECERCILVKRCKRGCPAVASHSGNILQTDGMCNIRRGSIIRNIMNHKTCSV